tara:strand:+ start:554 stop:856 length:303 start_codon:yes stop_codon:yes gene_type:complete
MDKTHPFLKLIHHLPVGLIEFVSDEEGNSTVGLVNPEILRIIAISGFRGEIKSLNPRIENNKALEDLTKKLEKNNIALIITGNENSDYLFFVDRSNLLKP